MFNKTLAAALAATTVLAGASAYAADHPPAATPAAQKAAVTDFGKLSHDAAQAYQDVTLTRLAIFDGRVADAKTLVSKAQAAFEKAKGDDSVFMKSEADLQAQGAKAANPKVTASSDTSTPSGATNGQAAAPQPNDAKTKAVAWLPVDGTVTLAEDYSMVPAKAKAVSDANKSLAKGDKKGAMETLRLADVDVNVVTAVVPLQATLTDVKDAAQLIDSGKYYEGSQKLRALQDGTMIVASSTEATPKASNAKNATTDGAAKAGAAANGSATPAPAPAPTH